MPNMITNNTRQRLSMLGLAFLLSTFTFALANPLHLREPGVLFVRRDDNSGPTTVWTPTVIVLVVFGIFGVFGCFTTAYFRRIRAINATNDTTPPVDTRELTAEQLAGAINGDAATNNATRRSRRPRRPRRTPSQISVTSLPEYMKEPGAEEVVIFRGQGLDEATAMPAAVVMDTLDEEIEDGVSPMTQRYSLIPTTSNDQPLLHDEHEEVGNIPLQNLSQDVIARRSFGSGSNDTNSLARVDSRELIGPSPAYFEVVDEDPLAQPLDDRPLSSAFSSPSPTPSHDSPSTRRQSGFRTFLNRMSATTGHQRNGSGNSAVSAVSGAHHRTTPSASSSFLNSLRPLSRQRSTHTPSLGSNSRLESPSVISLGSISSPLTHTAVRTGFTYPKSGPTPEQLKIIASVESIGRFAVPYGRDAIAFAASTSRHELDLPPPPGFGSEEDLSGPTHSTSASIEPLGSLTSTVSYDVEDQDISVGRLNGSSALDMRDDDEQPAPLPPLSTLHIPPAGSSKTHASSSVPTDDIREPQLKSSLTLLNLSSTNLGSTSRLSEFGHTLPLPSAAGRPSSLYSPSAYYLRSESVVSMHSARSYATAAESLDARSSVRSFVTVGSNNDVDSDSEFELPSTPKRANGHELELTEMTVRQVQYEI